MLPRIRSRGMPSSPALAVLLVTLALLAAGCASGGPRPSPDTAAAPAVAEAEPAPPASPAPPVPGRPAEIPAGPAVRTVTLLHVNDVYRIEGVDEGTHGGIARLRTLRRELEREAPDLLVLHAGDLLFPSLLSHTYSGRQMVDVLNRLDGGAGFDPRMLVTFGNHEFDEAHLSHAAKLDARVEESEFLWLDTNIGWTRGKDGRPLVESCRMVPSVLIRSGGVAVGIFGLTTDLKHPGYVDRFDDPVEVARRVTAELRARGAELVVGLTHLKMSEDVALLETLGAGGPDLVLGGHEHNCQAREIGGRWVLKADAEARTATVVRATVGAGGAVTIEREFRELGPEVVEDPAVRAAVDGWLERHDREYCGKIGMEAGCLSNRLGSTRVELVGEELQIRRFETNLGNFVADQALAAYAREGAQVAFLNSGSLRLNQDLPAGSAITRRHVEELFPYPAGLRLVRLRGETLQEAVSHAVEDWTGNGWWLQVAGMTFRHDPQAGTATGLSLLTPAGPRPVDPEEEILAVTSAFLAQGNDGYSMLKPEQVVEGAPEEDLKELVIAALRAAEPEGIAPEVEGRIVNPQRRDEHAACP